MLDFWDPIRQEATIVKDFQSGRGAAASGRARYHSAPLAINVVSEPEARYQARLFEVAAAPTFVDLFCGIGGFSLGCIEAGLLPLAAFDNDAEAVARYETNLGPHAHKLDLASATAEDILAATGYRIPDLIVGGPPCQGFSHIGKRDPSDKRSDLTRRFARLVADLHPKAFVMENVPGILTMGDIAEEIRQNLLNAGYANATWVKINAASTGVPQRRLRAFLIGSLGGPEIRVAEISSSYPAVSVAEALAGLPTPQSRTAAQHNAYVPYPKPAKSGSYDAAMRSTTGAVSGCQLTVHAEEIVKRLRLLKAGEVDELTSYQRMDGKGLAPTLRAGSRSRTACRPIHPRAARVITVREAARLHSFPDWFDFSEVVSLAHMQIGNSVPPRLAEVVTAYIRRVHLADVPADSTMATGT